MARVTFAYTEGGAEGLPHTQTTLVERNNVEDIFDLLDFLAHAIRAAGFVYDRVGVATEAGAQTWNRI